MSTQHPDNVAMPFFASGAPLSAEDEVREAYYAFSHLGCDEQMWDFEGKEVDEHVVEKLLTQYEGFFAAHRAVGSWPGGVHIEFTGEDVTECLGGGEDVREEQLDHRYETLCDPRLNARQSLDLAFRVAELMRA